MRVFHSIRPARRKVPLSCCVYAAELLYYAVEQPLRRRAASTLASSCSGTHTKVTAQRHQGDHHAAAREAYGPRPVLRHDRGGVKAIPKNEATHSFTSRRVQGRRAIITV